jgi:hypothetical protein
MDDPENRLEHFGELIAHVVGKRGTAYTPHRCDASAALLPHWEDEAGSISSHGSD